MTSLRCYIGGTIHDKRISDGTIPAIVEEAGFTVQSGWHHPTVYNDLGKDMTFDSRRSIALANFSDIDKSDLVLVVADTEHHLRGVHVEFGYAYAKEKLLVVVGNHLSLNTMCSVPGVFYSTLEGLPELLVDLREKESTFQRNWSRPLSALQLSGAKEVDLSS